MSGLIRRFPIFGTRIVALRSGAGTEESYFQSENELTIVGLDEGGTLAGYLESLPIGPVKRHLLNTTENPLGTCSICCALPQMNLAEAHIAIQMAVGVGVRDLFIQVWIFLQADYPYENA